MGRLSARHNRRRGSVITALVALTIALGAGTAWGSYVELAAAVDEDRLMGEVERFAALGSRVAGYPGNIKAADMVLEEFERLGMDVMVQEYELPTPLDQGASLTLNGETYDLAALWPNLVRTSQLPRDGISGRVIYVGQGRLSDYNGKIVTGSIVISDFNVGQNWINAALLDAAAIVFVEPERTTRGEAEVKYIRTPSDIPRFFVRGDAAAGIIAAATLEDVTGHLKADMPWVNVTNRNIIGIVPGTNPELSERAVIVQAYYDSISVTPRLSPGAESAVSIATLLELARTLKERPPARTVILLATSGHFQSLAGTREFVALWGREPRSERERVRQPRLRQHERELEELQRLQSRVTADLQRAQSDQPINVGQLQISQSAARARAARLERDIARKQNDIEIWHRLNGFDKVEMFISLDLSTHNNQFGVFQVGWYYDQNHLLRFYSPLGRQFADYAKRVSDELGLAVEDVFVDGINPVRGREWHTFFPGKIAFDHEMAIRGGRPGITMATVSDARSLVNTPLDTPERINSANMVAQARLMTCVLHDFFNDPTLQEGALQRVEALRKMDELLDVEGAVLEFRRRESFVPNTPVPNALVIVQGQYRMMMGVHTTVMTMANETSEFILRGERARAGILEAYGFDADDGTIIFAPDRGPDGDKRYPRDVHGRAGLKRPVIVFSCVPTDFFDLVDARYFQTLQQLFVFDAKDFSEPISFGYSLSETVGAAAEFPSYVEPAATVFSIPDVDLQIAMGMGLLGIRMVLINASEEFPEGRGFPAAETRRIPLTPLQVANDLWVLDEFRMAKLQENGIDNARLRELHDLARASLDTAHAALTERRYDAAIAAARNAWGYESRAYPEVQQTAVDVIKGLLFYLAILLPFAYFGERLFLAGRNVIRQIIGTVAVFVFVFILIALVHPAFSLTTAPPIILLSFIIMALAVLVIAIVTMKFNTELKDMKQQRGGVHEADVGRFSAAAAAFALGIANMRRRKTRTTLTAITLTLLTFTVLSFTSVKSYLRANQIRLTHPPAYQGVMLRDRSWLPLEEPTADIIANEMVRKGVVSPRAWYTSPNIERELIVDVALSTDPSRRYQINSILGLSPQERHVLPVEDLLVAGRWFSPGSQDTALLPTAVAESLGITSAMLGTATVTVFGTEFRVIGLLDETAMRNLQDLDGEPITPVDYAMMRPEILKELQRQAEQRSQLGPTGAGALLQDYQHFGPEKIIVLPYSRVLELGGTLRSVAVRYEDPEEVGPTVDEMMKRFALSLYTGIGRNAYLFSSVGMTALTGMESLIIPILIAAMIVLNTMLGSVYERTKEIGIFSSLGLAPSHISTLFLAEAAVFANMGAIVGYLIGQALARVLYLTGNTGGLELNYSSMSAVGVTVVIVVVVLLSTLYPSRRAADIASPGIERRWSLPEPQGDLMDVILPFTVTGRDALGASAFLKEFFDEYVGYAGGEFLAEDVHMEAMAYDEFDEGGMAVKLRMWLAPYDLGVSQDFALECRPSGDPGIYEMHIQVSRLAGDMSSWKKTNALFMSGIRKQFLIWRTVPQGEKVAYADRAEKILAGEWEEQRDLL